LNNVTYSTPKSELPVTNYDSPPANYHSPLTIYRLLFALFVQNKPNLQKPENHRNPLATNKLRQYLPFGHPKSKPKANPNKPKQSQSDPRFSPVMAPQTQNKPKQTQTKPISPKTPGNQRKLRLRKGLQK